MKRGTPGHPKTLALASALQIPVPYAVGLLEMLWLWAPYYAIRGDVGRWDDIALAGAMGWPGEAAVLIAALTKTRWLDEHPTCRLVIHDVHEHADNTWRQTLDDRGLRWWNGKPPRGKCGRPKAKVTARKLQDNSRETPSNSKETPLPEPEPEPSQRQEKPLSHVAGFARFWERYPRHEDGPQAEALWKARRLSREAEAIMVGLDAWLRYWDARSEPQYIPYPAKWLRGRNWEAPPPALPARPAVRVLPDLTGIGRRS